MRRDTFVILLSFVLGLCFVTAQAAPPEYQGFPDRYVLRTGDLNGDGRTDMRLHFHPPVVTISLDDLTIPVVPPPPAADFVLQQNATGGFDLVTALTAAQRAVVASWPEVLASIIYGDINVDGYIDILIRDVAEIIPQAQDVIVFAGSTRGAPPAHVRSVDAAFKLFMRDVSGWIQNPQHYYDPGLVYACQPDLRWVLVPHYDSEFGEVWYTWELIVVDVCGYYLNPDGYSIPALNFLRQFVVSLSFGDLPTQVSDAVEVSQRLEDLFGIPIFRGTLETGQPDFGLPTELQPILTDADAPTVRDSFIDRYRLERLFNTLRKMFFEEFCVPPGTNHFYEMTYKVCSAGIPGCTQSAVYFDELLFHPVTGYWDHKRPVLETPRPFPGYAELGCTHEIIGACDPIRMIGINIPGVGVLDGGPIVIWRFDSEFHHRNDTLVGHLFHLGSVDRWSEPAPGGGIQTRTVGTGTGQCPTLNKYGGMYIFWTLDRFIECHLANGCAKGQ